MIFDEIPVIGTFFRSLKTRQAILKGEELYKDQDWEVNKKGFVSAREFIITLSITAVLPSVLIKNIFQEDTYSYGRRGAVSDAFDVLRDFLLPFVIFLIATTAATIVLKKSGRTSENVEACRKAFMYLTGTYTFYYLLFFQLGITSLVIFGSSPLNEAIEEKSELLYGFILVASILFFVGGGLMLVYYNYYRIPRYLREIFRNNSRDGISYFFLYLIFMFMYIVVITLAMYALAFAWASIKD